MRLKSVIFAISMFLLISVVLGDWVQPSNVTVNLDGVPSNLENSRENFSRNFLIDASNAFPEKYGSSRLPS